MTDFCSTFSDTVGFWFFIKLEIKLIWNTFVYFQSRTFSKVFFINLFWSSCNLQPNFQLLALGSRCWLRNTQTSWLTSKQSLADQKTNISYVDFTNYSLEDFDFSLKSLKVKNQILIWFGYSDLMFFERPNVSATINILSFCRFHPSQPEKSSPSLILSLKFLSYFENLLTYW